MSRTLTVLTAGPGLTVQDLGRPGFLAAGLSRGGAADRLALFEAAALLGQSPDYAALEMAGLGGTFAFSEATRVALTGADMSAELDGTPLRLNEVYLAPGGARLTVRGARAGVYGYLSLGGGIATQMVMGSRATHLTVRIGGALEAGDVLPLGLDPAPKSAPQRLEPPPRLAGGTVRVLRTSQSDLFTEDDIARFTNTTFRRDPRGNRQGVRLTFDGAGFTGTGQLSLLSEMVQPGDIQMTGEGDPFVLMPECQTTGGYPRIATVHPADLPIVAQAAPGTALRFRFVEPEAALEDLSPKAIVARLRRALKPANATGDLSDLLGQQLISGVTAGEEEG